jgi:hypothetical protein
VTYSRVCPGVTWFGWRSKFVGSDDSHDVRFFFSRQWSSSWSMSGISNGAKRDLTGEPVNAYGAGGVVVSVFRSLCVSALSSEPLSWFRADFRRNPGGHLCLSAFLNFSTSLSHFESWRLLSGERMASVSPSLSLSYTRRKVLVTLWSIVCRLRLSQYGNNTCGAIDCSKSISEGDKLLTGELSMLWRLFLLFLM